MDQVSFSPEVAPALLQKIREVSLSGRELASFADREPFLASECGVEISALEVKNILGSGIPDRIVASASEAARTGRGFVLYRSDLDGMNRLEGVISTASSRIAQKYMALESAASPAVKLGTAINVVGGVINILKTIF
jgi:hypothetical protein